MKLSPGEALRRVLTIQQVDPAWLNPRGTRTFLAVQKGCLVVYPKTEKERSGRTLNRERAREMRHAPVAMEKLFWSELRNRKLGGYKFKRQFLIGNYIVDFVCVDHKLVVELDGPFHKDRVAYDEMRDAYLRSEGYQVMRFSNIEASDDVAMTLTIVLHALKSSPA